jgi:hypothetical protein
MPRKKSDKPKANPWAESQFQKAEVNGSPETWQEAAEALAPPPTDEQRLRQILTGQDYRKCHQCKTLKRPHEQLIANWKKVLPELADGYLVCPNENCPEYGKRRAS